MASKRAPQKKKPPKKRATPSSDPNVAAFDVVRQITQRPESQAAPPPDQGPSKRAKPKG